MFRKAFAGLREKLDRKRSRELTPEMRKELEDAMASLRMLAETSLLLLPPEMRAELLDGCKDQDVVDGN